jgi:hypothetical protein
MSKIQIEEQCIAKAVSHYLEKNNNDKDTALAKCCEDRLRDQVRRDRLIKILNLMITDMRDKKIVLSPIIYTGDKGLSEFKTVSFFEYLEDELTSIDIELSLPKKMKKKNRSKPQARAGDSNN